MADNILELMNLTERYILQQGDLYGKQLWGNFDMFGFTSLDEFYRSIKNCEKCALGKTRNSLVFGTGDPHANLVLIGEAPGRDEDIKGEPFVGRAGQLLTRILKAIDLERDEVYIANILKCRPPNNRDPQEDEIECCLPHLNEQLKLINPKVILALGRVAAHNLLNTKAAMKDMRGKLFNYEGIKLIVTYHPAALLRNPNLKKPTWEDVQYVRKLYNEL